MLKEIRSYGLPSAVGGRRATDPEDVVIVTLFPEGANFLSVVRGPWSVVRGPWPVVEAHLTM